jgi:hypothetical protein
MYLYHVLNVQKLLDWDSPCSAHNPQWCDALLLIGRWIYIWPFLFRLSNFGPFCTWMSWKSFKDSDWQSSVIFIVCFYCMCCMASNDKNVYSSECVGHFHFHFPSLCGLSMFKTLYSVLNTCYFLKSSKSLHVSARIGHPQVLIFVF